MTVKRSVSLPDDVAARLAVRHAAHNATTQTKLAAQVLPTGRGILDVATT